MQQRIKFQLLGLNALYSYDWYSFLAESIALITAFDD